jgi:hypothetical protein
MLRNLIAVIIQNPGGGGDTGGSITNPVLGNPPSGASGNAGVTFLQKAIPAAITLGFVVGIIVFFFMLLIGAIKWISSAGDKTALEGARSTITNALIGLVILFALFAIIQLINTFFGLHLMNLTLPTIAGSS